MIARTLLSLVIGAVLATAAATLPGARAQAQTPADTTAAPSAPPPTTPDDAATQAATAPADTSAPAPPSPARLARLGVGRDYDRFEFGAAVAEGAFDVLGTFAYHRYLRSGGPLENWLHIEVSGSAKDYLKEGTASVAYLLRPRWIIRRQGTIRPILEAGPGAHLVVQVADVEGFDATAFHSHAYLKGHVYGGFEALLGSAWGLVVRGRFTAPSHNPFDYAQIAVFLR